MPATLRSSSLSASGAIGSPAISATALMETSSCLEVDLHDPRVLLDFRGRALGQYLAVMEHGDAVGELHDDLHVVLDDEDRQVLGDAAHQRHRLVRLGRAHPRGRLVEAEQL